MLLFFLQNHRRQNIAIVGFTIVERITVEEEEVREIWSLKEHGDKKGMGAV
jgi:hypothetical protein